MLRGICSFVGGFSEWNPPGLIIGWRDDEGVAPEARNACGALRPVPVQTFASLPVVAAAGQKASGYCCRLPLRTGPGSGRRPRTGTGLRIPKRLECVALGGCGIVCSAEQAVTPTWSRWPQVTYGLLRPPEIWITPSGWDTRGGSRRNRIDNERPRDRSCPLADQAENGHAMHRTACCG
jgi:hypothetical protein